MTARHVFGVSLESFEAAVTEALGDSHVEWEHAWGAVTRIFLARTADGTVEYWVELHLTGYTPSE